MTRKTLTILTVLLTASQFGWTQTTFNYGTELGFSFSHFPTVKERTNMTDLITTETNPLISPLVGFYGQLTIKKHLQFTTGLQYQMTGTRYHLHRDGRIPRDASIAPFYYYTQDDWENQTFHKLCLSLTVGYTFKIGKAVRPSIFIGLRPNLFLVGNYNSKVVIDATDNSEDYEYENEHNPVDPDETAIPVDKFKTQYLLGLSTSIGQRFRIALTYNFGKDISYAQYPPAGGEVWVKSMTGKDFGIILTYFLKQLIKKTETTEKKE